MKNFFKTCTMLGAFMIFNTNAAHHGVMMHEVSDEGVGSQVGELVLEDSAHGVVLTPDLKGLSPGLHGFHLHAKGSCEPAEKNGEMTAAAGAGGHYDPQETGKHGTPWGEGHLGDLPALYVNEEGVATHPVLAPRLKKSDFKGKAIVIHAGGDNYADDPKPLGGGGKRVFCGVVK